MPIYGRQLAAARALLALSQSDVAKATSLHPSTIRRMETSQLEARGHERHIAAVTSFLTQQGVSFLGDNIEGFGVKLIPKHNK